MKRENEISVNAKQIISILLLTVLVSVIMTFSVVAWLSPIETAPSESSDTSAGWLSCRESSNLSYEYEHIRFGNLTTGKQEVARIAIDTQETPPINRSQANFFAGGKRIIYQNTTYYCVSVVS